MHFYRNLLLTDSASWYCVLTPRHQMNKCRWHHLVFHLFHGLNLLFFYLVSCLYAPFVVVVVVNDIAEYSTTNTRLRRRECLMFLRETPKIKRTQTHKRQQNQLTPNGHCIVMLHFRQLFKLECYDYVYFLLFCY